MKKKKAISRSNKKIKLSKISTVSVDEKKPIDYFYSKSRVNYMLYPIAYTDSTHDETDLDILNGRYGIDPQLLDDYIQYLESVNSIFITMDKNMSESKPLTAEKMDKICAEKDAKLKELDFRYPNISNRVATVSFEQLKKDKEFQEDEAYCKKMWETKNGFEMMQGLFDRIQKWRNRGFPLMHNISGENGQWLVPASANDAEYFGSYFNRFHGQWNDAIFTKRELTIPKTNKAIREIQKAMRKMYPQPRAPYGAKSTFPIVHRAIQLKEQYPSRSRDWIALEICKEHGMQDDAFYFDRIKQILHRAKRHHLISF